MRLAFVIQRYGLEVNGGAEMHCRLLAERLARRHQVEVFATRALDYLEWRNHYPKGTEVVNGIPVHRSTVRRPRNARGLRIEFNDNPCLASPAESKQSNSRPENALHE